MLPVQQQTFTIPAGGSFPWQVIGRYFRVQSASGTLKVFGDTFGQLGDIGVGQGLRLRDKDVPFQRLTFVDTSGAPNIVKVIVADSDFVDNSLLGTVSVVDGGKTRTLAGSAMISAASCAAVAAAYSHVQLWNPAGSGKNLIVEQVSILSVSAVSVTFRDRNAALANAATGTGAPLKKMLGGGASASSLLRTETSAGYIFTTNQDLLTLAAPANQSAQFKFTEPLVVPPGWGLVAFINNVQNTALSASFEHYEELQ